MTPFDFLTTINSSSKKDLMVEDPLCERVYNPFLINRSLSYFPDTVMYANELNQFADMDNKLQYSYLLNIVRPSKRFAKWVKKQDNNDVEAVKEYFGYGNEKALEAMSILSSEQIKIIKNKLAKGGNNERSRQLGGGDPS